MRTSDSDCHERLTHGVYQFGDFELDFVGCVLQRHGRPVALTNKSLDVLAYLVARPGRLVSRAELMRALWPNVRVSAGSLSQAIWEIRRALGDAAAGASMIQTLRGRGYRFVAPCAPLPEQGDELARAVETWSGQSLPLALKQRLISLDKHSLLTALELAALLSDARRTDLHLTPEIGALRP